MSLDAWSAPSVVAQTSAEDLLRGMASGLNRERGLDTEAWPLVVFGGLALVGGGLLGYRTWRRRAARRRGNGPGQQLLFQELCRAHKLDLPARRLLLRLARSQRVAQPARLFLEPERFLADRLGGALRARRTEIEALRERLFGEPAAETRT
jgi:hypothetical protein